MATSRSTATARRPAMTEQQKAVQPDLEQPSHETQKYGDIVKLPNGLSEQVCKDSVALLNQCLADTIMLRALRAVGCKFTGENAGIDAFIALAARCVRADARARVRSPRLPHRH